MEKINFTDATLKTQAYVTVGGNNYNVVDSVYEGGTDLNANTFNTMQTNIENAITDVSNLINQLYPVGSLYFSTNDTNPANIFGFGTWERWGAGRCPVGVDTADNDFNTAEKTGGEKKHILTVDEMPSHNHNILYSLDKNSATFATVGPNGSVNQEHSGYIKNTGGNQPHNNMQPYITCYIWKRTE